MRDRSSGLPLRLHHLPPPYAALEPLHPLEVAERCLVFGSILAVEIGDPVADWPLMIEWLPGVRSRFPAVPHIIWAAGGAWPALVDLARRAGRLGVRAVLVPGDPIPHALRRSLTEPADRGAAAIEWMGVRGVRLTPGTRELVRLIFDAAPSHTRIGELLLAVRWSDRSARSQFHKRRFAPPEQWLLAARAVGAALQLQADKELSATRPAGVRDGLQR